MADTTKPDTAHPDKATLDAMLKHHHAGVALMSKALKTTKDAQVRAMANHSLMHHAQAANGVANVLDPNVRSYYGSSELAELRDRLTPQVGQ